MSIKAIGNVTLINVDDGSQGEQGLSVAKVSTQYYLSTSSTSLSGGSWSDTQPSSIPTGKYLWERTKTKLSNNTYVYSDATYSSLTGGVISNIDNINGQITNKVWQSDITSSINSYDGSTVSAIRERVSTTEQNLTGITTRVGAVESTTNSLGTRMSSAESSITQNANNINLKVSKDSVISEINQSSESITISADKVNIEGATIFSTGRLSQTSLNNAYDAKGAAATVQTNLDNLEIGGRNYYKNYSGYISINTGATATKDASINGITGTNNTTSGIKTLRLSRVITEKGYWTVSGYIKTDNQGTLTGDICDIPSSLSLRTSSEYQYFSFTVNVTRDIDSTYHFVDLNTPANIGNFWIKDIKVEKGNKPTSWTPAPEDVEADIANAQTTANSANKTTVPVYYRSTTNSTPSISASTSIGTSNNTDNAWSYVMPLPKKNSYFYICEEYTSVSGTKTFSTVRKLDSQTYASKWVSSNDNTLIDGGSIYAHSITSSQLATDAIKSNNYSASQNTNSPYSATGTFLDLSTGNFYTPNFGLDNVNGNAYFNGEITATSGQIGDDTSNHWQIGTVVDFNGNQSAAIESNGTSYIQSGDWMISNNRIDTRYYDNQRKYTYLYEDGVYWDFGLHTPSLTSDNDYENNFIYIRNHESTIPTLEGAWNYVFRVDRNGMIYINGVSLDDKYASIDGVSGAYLPMTGGSLTGNLSVGGNLTVTGTVSGLKNLSINGKTYNGSSAVTVGTIGAAYGGTGQTSLINSANALINALDTGSSTPVDNDYYISQYVNGGTTTKTYHRRPMSALWLYIKGKINADTNLYTDKFVPKTGGEFTGAVTVSDALIADEITSGNLIVNGVGRFTNGIHGDLTGNASTATVAAKVADSGNGQATTFAYSKTGLSTTSDIAVWNGYELRKITPANLKTSLSLTKGDVGLGNVDNTADANKVVKGVSGIAGTANSNRHVWFSDTSPETSRNYDDDFMYNPSTNVLTVGSITGNAASATKLQTARNITIGNKTNSFDGSSAISYSLLDIGAVSKTGELQTTNPFAPPSLRGMYISKIDNAFYAADKRWNVTMTNVNGSVSNLFDGSYEGAVHIYDGDTSVLTLDFSTESDGYFPGFPYGYILVSFYYVAKPTSVSGRVYCNYASHGIGWHDISFMPINDNKTDAIVYRSVHQGYYQISSLEITIVGDTTNDYGRTSVTQVEMHLDRPNSLKNPFLTKYGAETLYYALTAPKFIGALEGNATSATSASKLNSTRSFTIGKTTKNVDWSGAVSFSQAEISDNASTSAAGWMSKDDKTKLNGIEANAQVNTITGVKGNSETTYRTGDVNITASNIGLGNLTNNKQVKGLSSGTTSGHLVTWGSDGYTVADSGIAKGSVTTKITLSGSDYSASSNTITITKANLQSAVQDTSLVLMTAAERSKLSSIQVSEGGTIDFSGVTASAPITATVNETTKAVNITHNTSGVAQGTYRSVTVNTYGHVTAGTNPTTLSGYGITDAKIASGVITLGSNTITPLTASSTLDATKLSGTASISTTGNAGTATEFSSNATITLTGDTTGSANSKKGWSITTKTDRLSTVGDNRSVGTTPNDYKDKIIFQGLKSNGYIGSPAGSTNYYSYLVGLRGWADSSGGKAHELAFNDNGIFTRMGSTTTWDSWRKLLDSSNYTDYTVTKTGTGASGTWGIGISGNATTATKFSSNRSIALTGDVTGSASSNGENGWSISTTVGDDSHNHTEFTLVPKMHKTYESTSYYATAANWAETSWFFFSVRPDSWTKPWKIKFKIRSYCPSYTNVDSITESVIHGRADSITYSNFTEKYDNGHYYIPVYPLKKAGYDAGYGHAIGVSIYYGTSYTNSAYYRTFELDYYSCENCTVTILDTPVKWANWTGTGSTNYGSISGLDATTRGYTESGDRNDPSYQQREYYASRTAYKFLGRYQLLLTRPDGKVFPVNTTDNNISTTKTYDTDTEFDPFGQIFYNYTGGTTAINTNVSNDRLYNQAMMDLRYAFNVGGNGATSLITARQPFYLVAIPQSNGMAKIHSSGFTQTLPTSDDGLIYIYLGMVYEDTNPYRLNLTLHHPVYWYKDGAVRQYIQRAETANTANSATNATTATNATNATNLLAYAGNEVIIGANSATRNECTNDKVYINYRDVSDGSSSNTSTAITDYYFCDRKGSTDGVNVRAGTFVGSLSGTATKATQDGDGNTISSTYLKLSGGTMTGAINLPRNKMSVNFRTDSTSYYTGFVYGDSGNEALALTTTNAVTSFMVVHGSSPTSWGNSTWNSSSPTLQTKNNSLYVHELIPNGTTPTYNFKVNGTSYLGGNVRISDTNADTASCEMQYNRDLQCLEFIFN